MVRKEGFIDIDKIFEELGVDKENIGSNQIVRVIEKDYQKIVFSFDYQGETYYYKYDSLTLPYSELVAAELANDYGISHVDYDLATYENSKGVISKDYKKENDKIIEGTVILSDFYEKYDSADTYSEIHNNLEDIWDALEYRYRNHKNKQEIVKDLMKKIVDIFVFDIITCQSDRHSLNWGIIENEDNVDILPLFDNERILMTQGSGAMVSLTTDSDGFVSLFDNMKEFNHISSDEFNSLIKEKLSIVSEENLNSIFERISNKTEYPMPDSYKEYYLMQFKNHRRNIENILFEEEIIRKR